MTAISRATQRARRPASGAICDTIPGMIPISLYAIAIERRRRGHCRGNRQRIAR
jgi:hypothetical protein